MQSMLAKAGAVFLQLEFFAAELAPDGVVVIAGLFANQEDGLDLLLSFA